MITSESGGCDSFFKTLLDGHALFSMVNDDCTVDIALLLYICSNATPVYNFLLDIICNSATHIIIIPTCSRALSCAGLKLWCFGRYWWWLRRGIIRDRYNVVLLMGLWWSGDDKSLNVKGEVWNAIIAE